MTLETILEWLYNYNDIILLLFIFSLVTAFAFTAIILLIIVSIPSDFFLQEKRGIIKKGNKFHFFIFVFVLILKNILGIALLLFGIVLLFIPGEGMLTIFISLLLIDFPGKRKLIRNITRRRKVINGLNFVRRKFGKSDFIYPE
ncbi:MAG: hypothetical protein FWD87_04290 [Spirochaetaceae bacterium]|nr:hypothetical protein [Spirochaetaceae bacterium]